MIEIRASISGFQTAAGPERAALLKKLKDLKQRCRLEARRQWLEWRLRLEENTSERLHENERMMMVRARQRPTICLLSSLISF